MRRFLLALLALLSVGSPQWDAACNASGDCHRLDDGDHDLQEDETFLLQLASVRGKERAEPLGVASPTANRPQHSTSAAAGGPKALPAARSPEVEFDAKPIIEVLTRAADKADAVVAEEHEGHLSAEISTSAGQNLRLQPATSSAVAASKAVPLAWLPAANFGVDNIVAVLMQAAQKGATQANATNIGSETNLHRHVTLVAFDGQLPVPDGWDLQRGFLAMHVTHQSNVQVLCFCAAVISLCATGWIVYYLATRSGTEMPSLRLGLLCFSFACCSWGMNVVNKALVVELNAPVLVTGAQMLMTVLGILAVACRRVSGTRSQVLNWSFIPFIFFGMLVTSFYTYQYLTLSMLMIIRNLGPIITLPFEMCAMPVNNRPVVTVPMVLALFLVLVSSVVYCKGATTSIRGLGVAMLNMILAIADRVAQRRLLTTECEELSTETCMFLNNFIGMIPTMILALCLGEFARFDAKKWFMSVTTILLIISGLIGSSICYFALAVQRHIAATSFMVLQNAVRMAIVAVGVFVFADPIGWPCQVCGLVMSFAGALWYGRCQVIGARQKAMEDDTFRYSRQKMKLRDG